MAANPGVIRFFIDRGGTFTDVYAQMPAGHSPPYVLLKLLSQSQSYADAPREAIRRILSDYLHTKIPATSPIPTTHIHSIRMGTTVATNALLERNGSRIAFVITKGFADLLHIGNQSRPLIFDLEIVKPHLLYEAVVEVDERVRILPQRTPDGDHADDEYTIPVGSEVVNGVTGERVIILRRPDVSVVRRQLQAVYDSGIRSLAIALVHSYTFKDHEHVIGNIAKDIGFEHVTMSSDAMPMVKIVPRSFTACADAYLTPPIQIYLNQFLSGFDDGIHAPNKVLFMQSDGGLTAADSFFGFKAVLSGPAGGVVGYSQTTPIRIVHDHAEDDDDDENAHHESESTEETLSTVKGRDKSLMSAVIGFDMGGTSTDVSRFGGRYEHVYENVTAGVPIQAPQLDINTVAAGGGSILKFENGLFVVGPESAGANPGPACYRRNGPLTVTDANLFLGRILPQYFPSIFGPHQDAPLDIDATKAAMDAMTKTVSDYWSTQPTPRTMSSEEVALGFIAVANEAMCRPIRALTQARGHDITRHTLACFGGAGGQHCCAIARNLGIRSIFISRFSGVLSAYGMGLADIVHEEQEPTAKTYDAELMPWLHDRIDQLSRRATDALKAQGFDDAAITCTTYLHLRYQGTDTSVMTAIRHGDDYLAAFVRRYQREYGFTLNRPVLVDDIRIRATGHSAAVRRLTIPARAADNPLKPSSTCKTIFTTGRLDTAVYQSQHLLAGDVIHGPVIIMDQTSTILVEPGCTAHVTDTGDVRIVIGDESAPPVTTELDSIQLSIFSHRFMSIAEQMGRTLQRTAISTNIKERLDFSCALFGPDGSLVANAPHLPVHLGAMQEAVRYQVKLLGDKWKDGDVIVTNHPKAGGSHLPDMTVITPVFKDDQKVFFVASRGHHADVGGISPGSMPPFSKYLYQEGAAIESFKLVNHHQFDEAGVTALLQSPGAIRTDPDEPRCVGTRNLSDNLSDLKAAVAANHRGIRLVEQLIDQYGLDVVQAYMKHIQDNAEQAVRSMLCDLSLRHHLQEVDTVRAVDYMDDGSRIVLALTIDRRKGTAIFDFEGTSVQVYGNTNSPPAVTYSAIIYCLRCLVQRDIPLNQGCLNPISINIPENSLLNPSSNAAIVGGNVLTSQRVTDVVLLAFKACAASQGCMSNTTFGDNTFGYYETIAGGAGAGPTWNGASGVHTHMTNCFPDDDHQLYTRHGFMYLHEVQARLAQYGAVDVGCYVDGVLEYHSIGPNNLIVHDGEHTHVEMMEEPTKDESGRTKATGGISLLPTANHRMYLRMGRTIGTKKHWPQYGGRSNRQRIAPPFAIRTAEEVMAAGAADASTVIQFDTRFEHGRHEDGNYSTAQLPFVGPLQLTTDDEVDAFIELAGYFLGDGRLDFSRLGICFGPCKMADWAYLDALFLRLRRVLPLLPHKNPPRGHQTVVHGVYVAPQPAVSEGAKADMQRDYCIYSPNWFNLFVAEYAHKCKGYDASATPHADPPDAKDIDSAKWIWYWMWSLEKRRARLVLSGLRFADGDESIDRIDGGQIGTSSARFRDEIVRLAIHAGYSAVFCFARDLGKENKSGHWAVSYTENERRIHPRLRVQTQCKFLRRSGTVWCVQVPTAQQLIMVRRVLKRYDDGTIQAVSRGVIVGNTRITDVEIMERRYPVLIRRFALRPGSGGVGAHPGGDGVIRDIQFLRPLAVGILSERRVHRPYGLNGGHGAQCGVNYVVTADGRRINLGGKNTYKAARGDRILICTPGGGGYGQPDPSAFDNVIPLNDFDDDIAAKDDYRTVHRHKSDVKHHRLGGSVHQYRAAQEQA